MDGVESLINEIDRCLPIRYMSLEGDDETLYVKDSETGEYFEIRVTLCD